MSEFKIENTLNGMRSADNICLFPLRLETHFQGSGYSKKLCVRIIPDEILLDYYKNGLNHEEIEDGRKAWMQWYIASGAEDREYDAWLALCAKYPTARAAWIFRNTQIRELKDYKKGGKKFGDRPYPKMEVIEKSCESIWNTLGCFSINEDGLKVNSESFENSAKKAFDDIATDLNVINGSLKKGDGIVDYLYDSIFALINNLKERVKVYFSFYDKYSDLKYNASGRQIFEQDYTALGDLSYCIDAFVEKFKDDRVSLSNLVDTLKENMEDDNAFVDCNELPKKNFEIPGASMLPERFIFVGKTNSNSIIRAESEKVSSKINLSIDPQNGSLFSVDDNGLNVADESVKWMFDYDAAVKAGMAITVNTPNITGFEYIYVFGVKPNADRDFLSDFFNGHNYLGKGLRLLNPRISTNVVDGEVPVDDEDLEKRIRYEIEIDCDKKVNYSSSGESDDAYNISNVLFGNYEKCWSHIVNFDMRTEERIKNVYKLLWGKLKVDCGLQDDSFIENFFIEYVRASGNLPTIKVGNLPYGILPVTDLKKLYDRLKNGKGNNAKLRNLLGDLLALKSKWDKLSNSVISSSNLKGQNSGKQYIDMAGQTPYSISYVERKEINSPLIEDNVPRIEGSELQGFNADESILNALFKKKIDVGQPILNTDTIYNINNSSFVNLLISNGYEKGEACNYVSEFMDLFTYRLDAWLNGVVFYCVKSSIPPKGLLGWNPSWGVYSQIGAYGWIFDLKETPSESSNEGKDHFVIAPSIQHALSAAVLRSAYLKSKSCETDSHVCVNLSSMRARQALRLVDGIRSGMSMSVVLGCDLERYLHDAALHGSRDNPVEMDRFIYPLRKLFPQVINIDAEDSRAEGYAMQVVNGEALLETIINHEDWTWKCPVHEWLEEHFYDKKMAWLRDVELEMDYNQKTVFFNIVERLMDSYDALNDLLLSEGVHRLVMGDHESFYAIGNFMANGEGNIPEPEILKTPSEHVVVSHKAGMILPQLPEISEKDIDKVSAFRIAEASVDSWVDSLIGGMNKISFFVKYNDGTSDVAKECSLSEVGVSASEYLYLSANPATFLNYLETRWCLNPENNYVGKVSVLESAEEAKIPCSEGRLSLEEDALRIQTIRSLLGKSRGMLPSDWNADIQEDKDDEDSIDLDDLAKRGANLIAKVKKLTNNLDDWIQLNSVTDVADNGKSLKGELGDKQVNLAYGYLCDCIEFGLVNCFTGFNPNAYMDKLDKVLQFKEREESLVVQEDLFGMIVAAYDELNRRIQEFSMSIGLLDVGEIKKMSSEKIKAELMKMNSDKIIEIIQNLTLKNIKVFPGFKLEYKKLEFGTYNIKTKSFEKESGVKFDSFIKNGVNNYIDETSFNQWQDEIAEVREGMKDVNNLFMAQTALGGESLDASIFQTTTVIVQDGNKAQKAELNGLTKYWLGLPVDDEGKLRDADSLVLYNVKNYKSQQLIVGFIFDGWLEYIPYKKHNAGLVFHCDRPDAEAPQALLLAVNPNTSNWTLESVESILNTTREMMKNRAVDPDLIYGDAELSRMFPLFGNVFAKKGDL